MTRARIQPCFRKLGVNLGYYNGKELRPRNITERIIALKLHNNHFCLIWISEGVSFNKAVEELGRIFKIDGIYITEENVNSHFEYIYQPKNIQSHITNFNRYDLELHNTDKARPYVFCF